MKLNILSDIHNEFSVLPIPETDADVVILAGDIDVRNRAIHWALQFNKPVIYVLGNHEFYHLALEEIRIRTKELTMDTPIHFLDDEEVVIDSVRFLGGTLWTDFNLFGRGNAFTAMSAAQLGISDFRVINMDSESRRLIPEDTVMLFEKTASFLQRKLEEPFSGKTVVVTHHAPSLRSIHNRYLNDNLTPAFASHLEYLFGEAVDLWIHGHVHHCNDYVINGTRVVSNPRGYQPQGQPSSENGGFDPYWVVEV